MCMLHRFATLTIVLAASLNSVPQVRAELEIVISSGAASPDGNGQLSLFNAPSINAAGQLAFVADLANTAGGTADNTALFRRDPDGLTLIARRGGTFADKPINTFFPTSTAIDSAGRVSAVAVLGPPNAFLSFIGDGNTMVPLVAPGSSSPSGNNTLLGMSHSAVNDAGVSVFQAVYNGANPEVGLYERAANGVVTTRALKNTPLARGGIINSFGPRPVINESNQIGMVLGVEINGGFISAVGRIDGTTLHEFVREGDFATDGFTKITEISTSTFSNLTPIPMINNAGKIAFPSQYEQPASRVGIFTADENGATLIVPGNSLTGGGSVEDYRVFGLSDSGQIGFWAEFFGGSDQVSGIYRANASGSQLIALEDTTAAVPGKFFRSFFQGAHTQNDAGQIAFLAELSDTANGAAAGKGLYFQDLSGSLQQIIRTGDALAGSTVTNLFYWGTVENQTFQSPDSSLTGLNSLGQVAFAYSLANGQNGIAVWSNSGAPGDYNQNGTVDAADFTVWCDNLGSLTALPNDDTPGVGPDDYTRWKTNFGNTAGAGSTAVQSTNAIPEPGAFRLAILSLAAMVWVARATRLPRN
jgi:hypothetical protein